MEQKVSSDQLLDASVVEVLEQIEEDIRAFLEKKTGLQILDHQFEISLAWNERSQQLDLVIDASVEFPPMNQETLDRLLSEALEHVTKKHETQLGVIAKALKAS